MSKTLSIVESEHRFAYTINILQVRFFHFGLSIKAVLNDTVKLRHENPVIGIIICKNKDHTIVEYTLKTASLPIGVATYQTTNTLPEAYKTLEPSMEIISQKFTDFLKQ